MAIFTRNRFQSKDNIEIVKGRDYFDLLWFLEKNVQPNMQRVNDLLKKQLSLPEVIALLDEKIKKSSNNV